MTKGMDGKAQQGKALFKDPQRAKADPMQMVMVVSTRRRKMSSCKARGKNKRLVGCRT